MSVQRPRSERIQIDRGNPFDPFNNKESEDYNKNKHKTITEEIIRFFLECGNPTCKLNYYQLMLGIDIAPPPCFEQCKKRLRIYKTGTNGEYPVVTTRRQGLEKHIEVIYISRPNMMWCWYHKLPIIFRPAWDNGFSMHHITGIPMHDDPEMLSVIETSLNTKIGAACRKIDKDIFKIQQQMLTNPSMSLRREIAERENEKRRISDIPTDTRVWDLIDSLYTRACNLTEI